MKHQCDNCGLTFADETELTRAYPDIPDLLQRLEPGGTVPSGECPNCSALVYPVQGHQSSADGNVVITIRKGMAEVTHCPPGVIVEIRDYDTEGSDPALLAGDGSIVTRHRNERDDWIAEFADGAAEELVAEGMPAEDAALIVNEAASIIREHENEEPRKE